MARIMIKNFRVRFSTDVCVSFQSKKTANNPAIAKPYSATIGKPQNNMIATKKPTDATRRPDGFSRKRTIAQQHQGIHWLVFAWDHIIHDVLKPHSIYVSPPNIDGPRSSFSRQNKY